MADAVEEDPKESGLRRLISTGSEIAGGAVGGALGFLFGGPAGAALGGAGGAAAAAALKHIGEEASERLLGPREQIRVGGVLALATEEVKERLEQGEQLRTDGFFDQNESGRSGAEEIAESVLLKSQREPEEKKLPYMAHLLSGIAFDSEISPELGHQMTKIAEQLTYRQLCILRLAVVKQAFSLRSADYRGQSQFHKELYQVLYECIDLYHRGLINFGGEVMFGPADVKPASMTVQGVGADIYNLMKLSAIPVQDLMPMVVRLS